MTDFIHTALIQKTLTDPAGSETFFSIYDVDCRVSCTEGDVAVERVIQSFRFLVGTHFVPYMEYIF